MSVMATSFVEAMTESDSSPKVVLPISVLPHVDASAHEISKYIYILWGRHLMYLIVSMPFSVACVLQTCR